MLHWFRGGAVTGLSSVSAPTFYCMLCYHMSFHYIILCCYTNLILCYCYCNNCMIILYYFYIVLLYGYLVSMPADSISDAMLYLQASLQCAFW